MRTWQILAASAVAGTIGDGILFLPYALKSTTGPDAFILNYWPGMAIIWLGVYGFTALLLSTGVAWHEISRAVERKPGQVWARKYLVRLEHAQYFTAVLALAVLGLAPVVVETEPFFSLPLTIAAVPALATCGIIAVAGLLGRAALTLTAAVCRPRIIPKAAVTPEMQLLRELLDLLHARLPEPLPRYSQLTELVERGNRSILEAIRELATATNKLKNGLAEMHLALQNRAADASNQSDRPASLEIEHVAREIRAAAVALTTPVMELKEIAATLSAKEVELTRQASSHTDSRSQLSTELHRLLRDMTPGSGRGDRSS